MTFPYDPLAPIRDELARLRKGQGDLSAIARGQGSKLDQLAAVVGNARVFRSGGASPGVIRIEDIPGRRVPFDLLIDIPIANNTTSAQQGSVTITQEGPFVAVRRMATFMSALEYQVTLLARPQGGGVVRFSGRSFGRYRPIHSAWDLNDALANNGEMNGLYLANMAAFFGLALNTTAATGVVGLPSTMSNFRTMEFDGRITVINAGSSYPRQNIPVPSSFWTTQIQSPFDLAALDFFERGETITVNVAPNHVNNPPAGNTTGLFIFNGGWPFVAGQFDQHEGIQTPWLTPNVPAAAGTFDPFILRDAGGGAPGNSTITVDAVTRLPDGVITIGWHGYRIQQPVSP